MTPRPWHVPMRGRDPNESHRTATPLELLFDLCFVVAVAQTAAELHHDVAEGQIAHGVVSYLVVFFGIWWPWVNFTWFASAYDCDDVIYRLLTFVQIAGVLVVTAGVPAAFEQLDFTIAVIGYVIMRSALVAQWLRAAREDPAGRRVALRYAAGISLVQIGWATRLALGPPWGYLGIALLLPLELLIPVWAERSGRSTPWHPAHVAERYGLFTIIVLGECVLAASTAVQSALAAAGFSLALLAVAVGGLVLVFALWWTYFKRPAGVDHRQPLGAAFAWGYGHYVIFASVAAMGAGLQVATEATGHAMAIAPETAALTVAVPAIVYLVAVSILHTRGWTWQIFGTVAIASALVLVAAFTARWVGVAASVLAMGVILGGLVATHLVVQRAPSRETGVPSAGE